MNPKIQSIKVSCYQVPTDAPESDGTAQWDHTGVVIVHAEADGHVGLGWSYASAKAAAAVVQGTLASEVEGQSAMDIEGCWQTMVRSVRNAGRPGVCSTAISAVDIALWDLKAKLLNLSLIDLFGAVRSAAPIYGSGGFTSYTQARLVEQLSGWVNQGIPRVKMKIGRDAKADLARVSAVRNAIGDGPELFVDANGAYTRKQALAQAQKFHDNDGVSWFEEPVSSDDLEGLHLIRDRGPAGMDIAAGEYGYTPGYFRNMVDAGAVDCLQADATRCGGYTGFFKAAALCEAAHLPLSAHCGPQIHAHAACCAIGLRHIEYFHDHVRIDHMLFDGVLNPINGELKPDRTRPGHGLTLKVADAKQFECD